MSLKWAHVSFKVPLISAALEVLSTVAGALHIISNLAGTIGSVLSVVGTILSIIMPSLSLLDFSMLIEALLLLLRQFESTAELYIIIPDPAKITDAVDQNLSHVQWAASNLGEKPPWSTRKVKPILPPFPRYDKWIEYFCNSIRYQHQLEAPLAIRGWTKKMTPSCACPPEKTVGEARLSFEGLYSGAVLLFAESDPEAYCKKACLFGKFGFANIPRIAFKYKMVYNPDAMSYALNKTYKPTVIKLSDLFLPTKELIRLSKLTSGLLETPDGPGAALKRLGNQIEDKADRMDQVATEIDNLAELVRDFTRDFSANVVFFENVRSVDELQRQLLEAEDAPKDLYVGGYGILVQATTIPTLRVLFS